MSLLALILAFRMPYSFIRKFGKVILILGLVMCGVLALLALAGSGLAKCELGACRWFNLGTLLSFQPAEVLKLGLILYLAGLMAERKKEEARKLVGFLVAICDCLRAIIAVCSGDSAGFRYWCNVDGDYSGNAFYEWCEIALFHDDFGSNFGCWNFGNRVITASG